MVLARVQLLGEDVEGVGVLSEIGDVEDGFGVGKVEAGEVGIETGVGRAEVRYCMDTNEKGPASA